MMRNQKHFQELKNDFLEITDLSKKIIKINGKNYNLREICEFNNEGLYEINIINGEKTPKYWDLSDTAKLIGNFKKPKSGTNFTFQNKKGETLNTSNFKLIDFDLYKDISQEQLEDVSAEDLSDVIGSEITKIVEKKLPKVIYWEYKDANLLPPSISINNFVANLNSCIPLKNLFILAGISEEKIAQQITEARNKSPNTFRSLLRRVSTASTNYFKKAWEEYEDIKFSLTPNGENIDCGVEEKNIWDFKKRSDGFKRFITILILLSIPTKKELLKNTFILIDEADTSLHPKGCRYLMEQLIEIAKSNYVVYSTHSIFMIDRENIERHYIVEKNKEITTIKGATEENYRDEEVLYRALGTSTFEILEEKNILFEGWDDKKLFEKGIEKIKEKDIKKFFKKIAKSHAIGAKSIKCITPVIEFSGRKYFILSDADQISKQEQGEFKENKGYGIWKRYDEIFEKRKVVTSEDFIKQEVLNSKLLQILKDVNAELKNNSFKLLSTGRLDSIKQQLKNIAKTDEQAKEIIKKLKEAVFRDLGPDDIEDDYIDFIKNLKQNIEKL